MSKPAFDPNKPFTVAETSPPRNRTVEAKAEKPEFDPTKPYVPVEDLTAQLEPGRMVIDVAEKIGAGVDRFTGAPTRAGIYELQKGKGLLPAVGAFFSQFGKSASTAPTGEMIAEKLGVPDTKEPLAFGIPSLTPRKVAGTGINLLADYTILGMPALKLSRRIGEGVGNIAKVSATAYGGKPSIIANAVGEGYGAGKRAVIDFFNPKIAVDWPELAAIAEHHGIDPGVLSEASKFGPNSAIARWGKAQAGGISGEERLLLHEEGVRQIRQATDDFVVNKIGNKTLPTTPVEAGEGLREAYKSAVKDRLTNLEYSYSKVSTDAGVTHLTPEAQDKAIVALMQRADKATRQAGSRIASKGTSSQGKHMAEGLQGIIEDLKTGNIDLTIERMREIGEFGWARDTADIGWDEKMARQVYDDLRTAVMESVGLQNPSYAGMLEQSNKELSDFLGKTNILDDVFLRERLDGKAVFDKTIGSGDSKKLEALRDVLGPDNAALKEAKAQFVENMKTVAADGGWTFGSIGRKIRSGGKYTREKMVMDTLFSPDESQGLMELITLGERHGPPHGNPSGTANTLSFMGGAKNVAQASANEGMIAALKTKAEQAAGPFGGGGGGAGAPPGAGPVSGIPYSRAVGTGHTSAIQRIKERIGPVNDLIAPHLARAANSIHRNRGVLLRKSLQTYSVPGPMERRLNK